MKIVVYVAMTVNGIIAKDGGKRFVPYDNWKLFLKKARNVGNLIIGRKTFEAIREGGGLKRLEGIRTIIVSKKGLENIGDFEIVATPEEAVEKIMSAGYRECLIGGGGLLNGSLLGKRLINEILLDVEPYIFDNGIKAFEGTNFDAKLELINVEKISNNEVQLHYKVL
ncbi:MAG: dihydrofolate reductase [Candidatus Marsarchaeota archaeon]|jgi:dihydrofolate reductase|nr:dihydrofolate reductase [Candidatus Marsarchaeota archaeon]